MLPIQPRGRKRRPEEDDPFLGLDPDNLRLPMPDFSKALGTAQRNAQRFSRKGIGRITGAASDFVRDLPQNRQAQAFMFDLGESLAPEGVGGMLARGGRDRMMGEIEDEYLAAMLGGNSPDALAANKDFGMLGGEARDRLQRRSSSADIKALRSRSQDFTEEIGQHDADIRGRGADRDDNIFAHGVGQDEANLAFREKELAARLGEGEAERANRLAVANTQVGGALARTQIPRSAAAPQATPQQVYQAGLEATNARFAPPGAMTRYGPNITQQQVRETLRDNPARLAEYDAEIDRLQGQLQTSPLGSANPRPVEPTRSGPGTNPNNPIKGTSWNDAQGAPEGSYIELNGKLYQKVGAHLYPLPGR